jgi:hypothetical protein
MQRCVPSFQVKSTGPAGHGSRFIKNTAMEKLLRSVQQFLAFRAEQEQLLEAHPGYALPLLLAACASVATHVQDP